MDTTAAAGMACCDMGDADEGLAAMATKTQADAEQRRVTLARRIAHLAADMDYPDTRHLSDRLHDIAQELAGNRVAEIYGPNEGDDVSVPATALQEG